jgi:hypothetical protein
MTQGAITLLPVQAWPIERLACAREYGPAAFQAGALRLQEGEEGRGGAGGCPAARRANGSANETLRDGWRCSRWLKTAAPLRARSVKPIRAAETGKTCVIWLITQRPLADGPQSSRLRADGGTPGLTEGIALREAKLALIAWSLAAVLTLANGGRASVAAAGVSPVFTSSAASSPAPRHRCRIRHSRPDRPAPARRRHRVPAHEVPTLCASAADCPSSPRLRHAGTG